LDSTVVAVVGTPRCKQQKFERICLLLFMETLCIVMSAVLVVVVSVVLAVPLASGCVFTLRCVEQTSKAVLTSTYSN
jgi:hypothetical protein